MKIRGAVMVFGMILVASGALAATKAKTVELKTPKDKASYAIGMDMANSLKKNEIDVDPDILGKAMKDVLTGKKTLMTEQDEKATLMGLSKEMQAKRQAKMKVQGEKNKKEGEAFLAANAKKEGVKSLPSGLQYKVITEGKGKTPTATDTVTVQYTGKLVDGTVFDSSYKHGQPLTIPVTGVIKGWTEALQMMKVGSKWEIYLPANLAYGAVGMPGSPIGPDAVLIFEVELVSIQQKAEQPKAEAK